jgi:histidine ammonia-lyase
VDAKVVQDHHGDPATRPGSPDGAAQLGDQWGGAATLGQLEVQVAVAPVDQPKAISLEVLAGRLHQPLARPASPRPHPGQGRVQRDLDLVLQGQVRMAKQSQQPGQILREQLLG